MPRALSPTPSSSEDQKPYTKPRTPKAKKGSNGAANTSSPSQKPTSWTDEEKWALFEAVYGVPSGTDWAAVAEKVGRNKEACRMRYKNILKKNIKSLITKE